MISSLNDRYGKLLVSIPTILSYLSADNVDCDTKTGKLWLIALLCTCPCQMNMYGIKPKYSSVGIAYFSTHLRIYFLKNNGLLRFLSVGVGVEKQK